MKRLLLLLYIAVLCSCSTKQKPLNALTLNYTYKSRVQVEDKHGKMQTVNLPGSKPITIFDQKTGKQYKSEGWVDPTTYNQTPGSSLKNLNSKEIYAKAQNCTRYEAILIIDEVRSRKKATGVKILAYFLQDKRPGLFSKKRNYWWYERKGFPNEAIEVRVYSAFALQEHLKEYPRGMSLGLIHDEYLFFAQQGKSAISKEDVIKVWSKWWQENQRDYL